MQVRHLVLATALGVSVLILGSAQKAQACCCCWGWGGGWGGGGGYGYGYAPAYNYRPATMYYPPAYRFPPRPILAPGPATTYATIRANDNTFDPAITNVEPGTIVTIANNGKHVHTVTSNDGKFDSGDIPPGGIFSVTFLAPGTYRFHCKHHKGMEGTIVVSQPGSGKGGVKGVQGN